MIDGPYEGDAGRKVLYRAHDGHIEEGVVSSWNSAYVFVRYGTSVQPQATDRDQLEWINGNGDYSRAS